MGHFMKMYLLPDVLINIKRNFVRVHYRLVNQLPNILAEHFLVPKSQAYLYFIQDRLMGF